MCVCKDFTEWEYYSSKKTHSFMMQNIKMVTKKKWSQEKTIVMMVQNEWLQYKSMNCVHLLLVDDHSNWNEQN